MSSSRSLKTSGIFKAKRLRKSLSLAVKLDIIKRLDRGERIKTVCSALNLATSTVHTIYKQKDKVLKAAETCFGGVKLSRVTITRSSLMTKLESLLAHWIESFKQQNVPLTFSIIQEQALALFEDLKKEAEEDGSIDPKDMEFKASHGWFERFKRRVNLNNMHLEEDRSYAEFDACTVKSFPHELQRIVEECGYVSKQIFNIDEVGLYWKRLPSQSFIAQEETISTGFKVSNERLTLMLGGNLDGDCKLKPLLVYYSENPKTLKGLNKASLPVIWRSNKKACVQKEVFADYITSYLSPFLTSYFAENKLDNKALIVIDNAPGHLIDVEDYADNIKVVLLPQNATFDLQPMDQGISSLFRAHYLSLVMRHLVCASDGENEPGVKALWKNYNIKMAIENIVAAWNKITQSNMNSAWKNLLPKYVYYFQGFVKDIKTIQEKIVQLAIDVGFYNVDQSDVQALLDSHSEELTREEILQLEAEKSQEKDEDIDDAMDVQMKTLDIKTLSEFFTTLEKAMKIIEDNDPNLERSSACKRKLTEDVQCYRRLLETKKKAVKQTNVSSLYHHRRSKHSTSSLSASEILMEIGQRAINGSGILLEIEEKNNLVCSEFSPNESLEDSTNEDYKLSQQELAAFAAAHGQHQVNHETSSTHASLYE